MKKRKAFGVALLCCVTLLFLGAKAPVGHTSELYVNDYAGVVREEDKNEMMSMARALDQQTGAQVAVLTVNDLGDSDIESYAYSVAEDWGLGKAGEDNGVLILLSTGDRMSRIEVGYGLEGTLTDILTGRIQDNYMLPYYRDGDYSTGLKNGMAAVVSSVYQHYGLEPPENLPPVEQVGEESRGGGIVPVILLLLLLSLFLSRGGRGGLLPLFFFPHHRGGGRGGSGGFGGGGFTGGGGGFGGGGSSRRF